MKEEEFIKLVNKIAAYSRSCRIPIELLTVHITDSERQLTQLKLEVENIRKIKARALIDHNITIGQLEEYEQSKPLICKINELRDRVKSLQRMNAELDYNLAKEQYNRYMEKSEWSIPEDELTKIAVQYSPFRSMDKKSQAEKIFDIAKSFINHPAQCLDIIESIQKTRSV